jgi:hypothetical protein
MDQGDIAVVKFKGGIPEGYAPAKVISSEEPLKVGAPVTLSGYGISNAQRKTGAGVLRKTNVKIAKARKGKSEMILDQSHGHGACHGDSGGPAYVRVHGKMVLAGVTNRSYPSRGQDDCAHGVVYTKLSAYRSWIKEQQSDPNFSTPAMLKKVRRHTRVKRHSRAHQHKLLRARSGSRKRHRR